jgi:phosphinothricin acetyltransferase
MFTREATLVVGDKSMSIRVATANDAAAIQAIYAPIVERTFISFETEPPSIDEMQRRIQSTLESLPWLVYLDDIGRVAGYAYASMHGERQAYRWSVNVSVYLREDARGKGVGRRLYETLLPLLASLGYYQVFAGIALPNPASVALHESFGFLPLGAYRNVGHKLGAWRDVGYWQLELRAPASDEPAPPRAFSGRLA